MYISTRNTNDSDKSDYATSFRKPGRGKLPPEPCVDDYIVEYNMANLNVQMPTYPPIVTPPVDPPPTTPPPTSAGTYTIISPYNLRSSPEIVDSNKIIVLPGGKNVIVEKIENGWAKISAYISTAGLKAK